MLKDSYIKLISPAEPLYFHWVRSDGSWHCINHKIFCTLCDWLSGYGFDIPDYIDSCVCSNEHWHLTFNQFGDNIYVKLYQKLNSNEQTTSSRN